MHKHEIVTPENHLPAWIYLHNENSAAYIEPHWHSSIELSYTIEGHIANFFIDGQSYTTSAGRILLVNTMEVHSIRTFYNPNIEQKALSILFPYHIIKNYKSDIGRYRFELNQPDHFSDQQKIAYQELQNKLDNLVALYGEEDTLRQHILLLEIVELLIKHFLSLKESSFSLNQEVKNKERIQDIKYYIEEHFQADIDLEDIAKFCFLSKEYLSRFFKENMGITVFQYLNYVRAKQAKKLLCETNYSATRVASECGFSGIRTMDRALMKNYYMTSRQLKTQASD